MPRGSRIHSLGRPDIHFRVGATQARPSTLGRHSAIAFTVASGKDAPLLSGSSPLHALRDSKVYSRAIFLILALIALLAGCIGVPPRTTPSVSWPASFPPPSLTTIPISVCHPVAVTGVLRSDPTDVSVAWLETPEGDRIEVAWPVGYRANWNMLGGEPWLEVQDAQGRPFITTTDIPNPSHVCDSGRPNTVVLMQTSG